MLWFIAGWQKLAAFEVFAATLADYRMVPRNLVNICAGLVAAGEVILGAGLVVPVTRSAALLGSGLLLTLYAAAMAINLLRGRRHIDCGCMGPAARQTLSGWLVARNVVIALVAALSAGALDARPLVWLDVITIGAGVAALAFVYSAVNHLIANAPGLAQLKY